MTRINITIEDGIDPIDAITVVWKVIAEGKNSIAIVQREKVPHYTWATIFHAGLVVWVRRKNGKNSADSFHVYREKK